MCIGIRMVFCILDIAWQRAGWLVSRLTKKRRKFIEICGSLPQPSCLPLLTDSWQITRASTPHPPTGRSVWRVLSRFILITGPSHLMRVYLPLTLLRCSKLALTQVGGNTYKYESLYKDVLSVISGLDYSNHILTQNSTLPGLLRSVVLSN